MKLFEVPMVVTSLVGLSFLMGLDAPPARADFTFGAPVNIQSDFPFLDIATDYVDCLSTDGLELYFTHPKYAGSEFVGIDIYVARRATVDSEWGVPVNAIDPSMLPAASSDSSISADGLSLYFAHNPGSGVGLYVAKRATKQDNWGTPVSVGAVVNTASAGGPCISADGLELYFVSGPDRPGGQGNADVWVTTRATVNDEWGPPVNLGQAINSPNWDGWPSLSPDGLLFFLCSNRPGANPWGDIYVARRASRSAPWQPAVSLGPVVNATCWNAPLVSADGSTLYIRCDPKCDMTYWTYKAPILPTVDFNGDSKVDLDDLRLLIENWGTDKTLYDIGPYAWGDGKVDIEDLKAFTAEWERQNPPAQP